MFSLKRKLQNKQRTIGSWLSFSYPPVCEMMIKAGFEWLVIDMEHTGIDFADARLLIQLIDLAGCTPLVRVGANDPLLIKRAMDAGAQGVIVPMVNSVADARSAVAAAYYPPLGTRGVGLYRAQEYGAGFEAYRKRAAEETVVIVQIEHIYGVRALQEILAVEHVDGFIVGPYDLSASIGHPGEFDHPEVRDALTIVENTIKTTPKAAGFHVVHSDHDALRAKIREGYSFIAYGDDMVFLAEKLKEEAHFLGGVQER
ncbi:MAG: aldolase/citrate lyase family protein [Desulfobacteraceae bacterium]|nr:aldolase/citrate lyase family protein [Desulfobacteraceae bacterium]